MLLCGAGLFTAMHSSLVGGLLSLPFLLLMDILVIMNRAVVNIPTPDFCRAGPGVHRRTSLPWIRSRTFNPIKREGVVWAQTQVGW